MQSSFVSGYTRKICNKEDLDLFAAAAPDVEPRCVVCEVIAIEDDYDLHSRQITFNPGAAFDFGAGGKISFLGSTVGRLFSSSKEPVFINTTQGRWKQNSLDSLFSLPSAYDLQVTEVEFFGYDPDGDAGEAIESAINSLKTTDSDGLPVGSSLEANQTSNRFGVVFFRNDVYHTGRTIKPVANVSLIGTSRTFIRAMDGFAASWLVDTPPGNRFEDPLPAPLATGNESIVISNINFDCRNICNGIRIYADKGSRLVGVRVINHLSVGMTIGKGTNSLTIIDPVIDTDNDPFTPGSRAVIVEGQVVNVTVIDPWIMNSEFGFDVNNQEISLIGSSLLIQGGYCEGVRLPLRARFPKSLEWTGGSFVDSEGNDTLAEVVFNAQQNNVRVAGAVSNGFDRVVVTESATLTNMIYRVQAREDDPAVFDDFSGDPSHRGIDFSLQSAYGPPSEHITSGLTPFLD